MEILINIIKEQFRECRVTDILQTDPRELDIVISTLEDIRGIKKMAELIHDDSEVRIKGGFINFVDQYGTRYEAL